MVCSPFKLILHLSVFPQNRILKEIDNNILRPNCKYFSKQISQKKIANIFVGSLEALPCLKRMNVISFLESLVMAYIVKIPHHTIHVHGYLECKMFLCSPIHIRFAKQDLLHCCTSPNLVISGYLA